MTELPKWPNPDDFYPPKHLIPPGSSPTERDMLKYERVRAEAAIARLRLAHEALKKIADFCSKQEHWLFDSIEDGADVTLARIGEIPE